MRWENYLWHNMREKFVVKPRVECSGGFTTDSWE